MVSEAAALVRELPINTSTLADILDGYGHYGVLSSRIRRASGHRDTFVGQAYTVRWVPVRKSHSIKEPLASTWEQVRPFLVPELREAGGKVYVAGGGPLITEAALAGGLSASYFQELGFEGVVLGGAIRDPRALAALRLPVACTNYIPTDTQGSYRVDQTGTSCLIENVLIHTGDWIVSDEGGTVVIPDQLFVEVVDRAKKIEATEDEILERVRNKEPLPEIIDQIGRI